MPPTGSELTVRCFRECVDVGLLDASDALLTSNQVDTPYAYVIHDHGRAERVARIRDWLATFDIILADRYSEWLAPPDDRDWSRPSRRSGPASAQPIQCSPDQGVAPWSVAR